MNHKSNLLFPTLNDRTLLVDLMSPVSSINLRANVADVFQQLKSKTPEQVVPVEDAGEFVGCVYFNFALDSEAARKFLSRSGETCEDLDGMDSNGDCKSPVGHKTIDDTSDGTVGDYLTETDELLVCSPDSRWSDLLSKLGAGNSRRESYYDDDPRFEPGDFHPDDATGYEVFVVEDKRCVGLVHPTDLLQPLSLFCLSSLCLDLERLALDLCTYSRQPFKTLKSHRRKQAVYCLLRRLAEDPWTLDQLLYDLAPDHYGDLVDECFDDGGRVWDSLEEGYRWGVSRVAKQVKRIIGRAQDFEALAIEILETYESTGARLPIENELVEATTFIDKFEIIRGRGMLIDYTQKQLKRIAIHAEKYRNLCCHPRVTEWANPTRHRKSFQQQAGFNLPEFIDWVTRATQLCESMQVQLKREAMTHGGRTDGGA